MISCIHVLLPGGRARVLVAVLLILLLAVLLVPALRLVDGKPLLAEGDLVVSVLADALRQYHKEQGDIPFAEDEVAALLKLGSHWRDAARRFRMSRLNSERKALELPSFARIVESSTYCNCNLEDAKNRGYKLIFVWTERLPTHGTTLGYYPCIDLDFYVQKMHTTVRLSGVSVEEEWLDNKPFP